MPSLFFYKEFTTTKIKREKKLSIDNIKSFCLKKIKIKKY